ncbi:MAG: glycosyltransferase family 2 protein [Candidatus Margulisbacteria bacterium]|jgi:hypothetical protein|nr:glycosyltransferase family 2 protein [Candidatus Margulisiibacteriota bacterium]
MRLISITVLKNEEDIIESFVRYHVNFMDQMLMLDTHSTDATLDILAKLAAEGLPVRILKKPPAAAFEQAEWTNELLALAVGQYQADIVFPLDADEFVFSSGKNNRETLIKNIDLTSLNVCVWQTYIPQPNDCAQEHFIPKKITNIRRAALESFHKIICPANLVRKYSLKLTAGNHDAVAAGSGQNQLKYYRSAVLKIAHYPIRSANQLAKKILTGWLANLARSNRPSGELFHQKIIFDKLAQGEAVTPEDCTELALSYALTKPVPPPRTECIMQPLKSGIL